MKQEREPKYHNGYQRSRPSLGKLNEKNTIINPLPAVGSRIILEELVVYTKKICNEGNEGVQFPSSLNRQTYCTSKNNRDPWNRPIIYTVDSYTHGIENPLKKENKIILTYETVSKNKITHTVNTVLISTGAMRAVHVKHKESEN